MKEICYIIGNGPSFNNVPDGVIENFPTFGMNYCGFQPRYYVCVDTDIITKHSDDIFKLVKNSWIAFLSELLIGVNSLYDFANVQLIARDEQSFKAEQYMSGLTAAYVALKCAYYLGFDEVHLYGIDHSPTWEHYRPDYRIGKVTNYNHMSIMEKHYQLAANIYSRAGKTIINHSQPSKLDTIFRRAL
jgi:hypothetical protein